MDEGLTLTWRADPVTSSWAQLISMVRSDEPQRQYPGCALVEATWVDDTLSGSFPAYCGHPDRQGYLQCSPQNIIACFAEGKVLEGLVLTVGWGGMARTRGMVYARPNETIEHVLLECRSALVREASTQEAWGLLTGKLAWTDVISSKCLHFMVRALGCTANPPVPIDHKVIERQVWEQFKIKVRSYGPAESRPNFLPLPWRDSRYSWQAYNRYMTAVNTWADQRGWSTTEVENTLFADWG